MLDNEEQDWEMKKPLPIISIGYVMFKAQESASVNRNDHLRALNTEIKHLEYIYMGQATHYVVFHVHSVCQNEQIPAQNENKMKTFLSSIN